MSEANSPETGSGEATALSFSDGVAAIESLLDDVPETDSVKVDEGQKGQKPEPEVSAPTEVEASAEDEDDDLVIDDESETEDGDGPSEPEIKDAVAAKTAKVVLDDGTTTTVQELIEGNMFQRKYTQKTQALAEERKAFEADQRQVTEYAQQLAQQRDIIMALASQELPKEPTMDLLQTDPIGYMEQKAKYDERMGKLHALYQAQQQETEQLTAKQQKELAAQRQTEEQQLYEAVPKLKDKKQFDQFRAEALDIGQKVYGVKPEELGSVVDHRFIHILHDAIAYRKAIAKRDQAKTAPTGNAPPKLVAKQRMAPQGNVQRDYQQAMNELRKTGSINAAAKAIEQLL